MPRPGEVGKGLIYALRLIRTPFSAINVAEVPVRKARHPARRPYQKHEYKTEKDPRVGQIIQAEASDSPPGYL